MKGVQCYELFGVIILKIAHFLWELSKTVSGGRISTFSWVGFYTMLLKILLVVIAVTHLITGMGVCTGYSLWGEGRQGIWSMG